MANGPSSPVDETPAVVERRFFGMHHLSKIYTEEHELTLECKFIYLLLPVYTDTVADGQNEHIQGMLICELSGNKKKK